MSNTFGLHVGNLYDDSTLSQNSKINAFPHCRPLQNQFQGGRLGPLEESYSDYSIDVKCRD